MSHWLCRPLGIFQYVPLKSASPSGGDLGPYLIHGSLGPTSLHYKQHLDWFSCFWRVHGHDWQTTTPSLAVGHILMLWMHRGIIIITMTACVFCCNVVTLKAVKVLSLLTVILALDFAILATLLSKCGSKDSSWSCSCSLWRVLWC